MFFVKDKKFSRDKPFFIFGVPFDVFSKESLDDFLKSSFDKDLFHRIATVGPEFLLRAREDGKFKENLLKTDLRVVDGFGVTLVGWLHGRYIPRFSGADLLHEVLKEAEMRNLSVFLAIKRDGLSSLKEIQTALLKKYPKLKIYGEESEKTTHYQLPTANCSIVFSNFGAPDQEYFLESLRGQAKSVRLAMGVGGAFDFLTGKLPRAPKVFRALGVEWLWRLFLQPKRWRRIWRAVAVFPMVVVKERFF